jgi:hypothetical protein
VPAKRTPRKTSRRGGRATPYAVLLVLVIAIVAAGVGFFLGKSGSIGELFSGGSKPAPEEYAKIDVPAGPEAPLKPEPIPPPSVVLPPSYKVAIVIDDLGQSAPPIEGLLALDLPITFAVLPHLKYSTEAAERAHERGLDVLLHAPMEPKDSLKHDAGRGVLLTGMSEAEIRNHLANDLSGVPHAIGVNNHMGSKFTENERTMRVVLGVLKDKNLFFLDSKTTAASVGERLAGRMGVRNAGRDVFLDNEQDVKYIKGQIARLIKTARKEGSAIAIGHPYKETIAALNETAPEFRKNGIEVVRLSELVD